MQTFLRLRLELFFMNSILILTLSFGLLLQINRDTNGNDTTTVETIEIPPPRPKRKSINPYPRKLVEIPKNEICRKHYPSYHFEV
jgi:hypothetical protein